MLARLSALVLASLFLIFSTACHHSSHPGSLVSTVNSGVTISTSGPVVANGMDSTIITVTVVDNQGNPIEGARVEPQISGTNNVLAPISGFTDANGVFQTQLTSITAEDKLVTIRVFEGGMVVLDETPSIPFIGDAATIDPALSTAEITPATSTVADGTTTGTVRITVRDINGNGVPGQSASIAVTGSNNTLVQPSGVTNAMGQITGTVASITAEDKTVTATIDPGGSPMVVSNMPVITFIGDVDNLDLVGSSVTATPNTGLLADGTATSTIDISLLDNNGNPVPEATSLVSVSGGSNSIGGPPVTDAAGMTSATLASVMAEVKTVTVSVTTPSGPVQLADQPTVEFAANPATISDTLSSIAANPATGITANGTALSTVTVTVSDENGNGVSGQTVTLNATGGGNTLTQPAAVTDVNGQTSGTLASTMAEVKTLGATIDPGGSAIALVNTTTATFAAAVSPGMSSVSATPTAGIAGNGQDTSVVTVTLRDASGNALPDRSFTLASTGTGNVITQPAGLTNASGIATATIASTIGETKTLMVTADPVSSPTILTDQPMVTFVQVAVDPALSSLVLSAPFGALADGVDTVTVTATILDAASMAIVGRPITLTPTGVGNVLTSASGTTDSNGMFTATWASTIAEVKGITATMDPGVGEVVLNDMPQTEFVWPRPGTWYVRTSGDDGNAGNSPLGAFETLGAAALVAQPGDVVYVGGGIHDGLVTITTGGTVADPILWFADSDGEFTNDPGDVVIDAMAGDFGIRLSGAGNVILDGFTFVAGSNVAIGAIDIVGASDNAILRNNRLYNNALGVRINGADNAVLEDNSISNNTADGVLLEAGADGGMVINNLIYNNGGSGLRANAVSGLLISLNTLYLNASDQLRAENGAALTAQNNIVADGLGDGIVQTGVGTVVTTDFNDSFGHSAGSNWQGVAQGPNDVSTDPIFQDVDGADNQLGGAEGIDDRLHVDAVAPSLTLDAGTGNASAVTLSSGDTGTDRTTRSDEVLDGEAADGPVVNMGFHYRPIVDPLMPLEVDDGRLFYGEGAFSRPRVRDWDDSLGTWGSEMETAPAATRIQYAVHEQSIIADGEEYLVVLSTDGVTSDLEMVTWTGAKWRREWSTSVIDTTNADKRGFDLGFEQTSAHGLVVYSDNTATPVYRTRENGRWSDAAPLPLNDAGGPNPDPNSGVVLWVELIEKEGSNEITLMYADGNADLVAMVWDGTQWVAASVVTLETSLKVNPISGLVHNRAFDGAYESLTGDFVCVWGRNAVAGFFHSQRATGGFAYTAAANVVSMNGNTHYADLAAEPGTDRIAAGLYDLGDGTERLGLSTWDGTTWVDTVELDSQILDVNDAGTSDLGGEVAWLGTTGTAVCVYPDNQAGTLDWATWTAAGGWVLGADVMIAGKGTGESAFLRSFPNQDKVLAVFADSNGALYSAFYDGTSWTVTNGGAPLETDLSTIGAAPFSFAFER